MKTLLFGAFLILISIENNPKTGSEVCLSSEEKKLYDLMMEYRKSKGLNSIPLSAKLISARR